jgi:hypothetical protein
VSDLRLDSPRYFRAPVDVADSEWLFNQAKSQAGQELFVIAMTEGRQHGRWLEIGCGDPIRSSNTYLLEKKLQWSGISIDMERMDRNMITPFEGIREAAAGGFSVSCFFSCRAGSHSAISQISCSAT